MKKIHPRVLKLTITLLTFLIIGGSALAIKEATDDPTVGGGNGEDGG